MKRIKLNIIYVLGINLQIWALYSYKQFEDISANMGSDYKAMNLKPNDIRNMHTYKVVMQL